MTCKEVMKYASNINYSEGCEYENKNKGRCTNAVKRDFYKTVLETFNFLRKIHKVTSKNEDLKNIS